MKMKIEEICKTYHDLPVLILRPSLLPGDCIEVEGREYKPHYINFPNYACISSDIVASTFTSAIKHVQMIHEIHYDQETAQQHAIDDLAQALAIHGVVFMHTNRGYTLIHEYTGNRIRMRADEDKMAIVSNQHIVSAVLRLGVIEGSSVAFCCTHEHDAKMLPTIFAVAHTNNEKPMIKAFGELDPTVEYLTSRILGDNGGFVSDFADADFVVSTMGPHSTLDVETLNNLRHEATLHNAVNFVGFTYNNLHQKLTDDGEVIYETPELNRICNQVDVMIYVTRKALSLQFKVVKYRRYKALMPYDITTHIPLGAVYPELFRPAYK